MDISSFKEVSEIVTDVFLIKSRKYNNIESENIPEDILVNLVQITFGISFSEYIKGCISKEDFQQLIIAICSYYDTIEKSISKTISFGIILFLNTLLPKYRNLTQEEVFEITNSNADAISLYVKKRLFKQGNKLIEASIKVKKYEKFARKYNNDSSKNNKISNEHDEYDDDDEKVKLGIKIFVAFFVVVAICIWGILIQ